MVKNFLLIFMLFMLCGCEKQSQEWNPIFEDTHFNYLTTEIDRSLSLINDVNKELSNDEETMASEKLHQARNRLLQLKDYYVPLTSIRQKIYDAERYLKLDNSRKTGILLNDSKSIIMSLESNTKNKIFDKVLLDLNAILNEAVVSLDNGDKSDTYQKMKRLGEHVNLMLYKGDLILSGVEFK